MLVEDVLKVRNALTEIQDLLPDLKHLGAQDFHVGVSDVSSQLQVGEQQQSARDIRAPDDRGARRC
jgi:hypothetical protein